jgi:hypothetical protein
MLSLACLMQWRIDFNMVDWLKVTSRMSLFGSNLKFFGKAILSLSTIISIIFFWFIVLTYYTPYQEVAGLMIKLIRSGLQLFIFGFVIHYLFYFINELVHKKQMKKVSIKVKVKVKKK